MPGRRGTATIMDGNAAGPSLPCRQPSQVTQGAVRRVFVLLRWWTHGSGGGHRTPTAVLQPENWNWRGEVVALMRHRLLADVFRATWRRGCVTGGPAPPLLRLRRSGGSTPANNLRR